MKTLYTTEHENILLIPDPHAGSKISVPGNGGIKVSLAVTILKPAQELYNFWRDLRNLTKIIKHPVRISTASPTVSRWVVNAPLGQTVSWNAEIINDHPGQLIAWRSLDGADVDNAGSVRFEPAPGDEGTEVTVTLQYAPPGGSLGAAIARFTRDSAEAQVYDALRRFKALMEAGEIPSVQGQSAGANRMEKGST